MLFLTVDVSEAGLLLLLLFFPFSGEWLRDGKLLSWVSQKEVISVTGSSRVL
jgi:hypothetical protein